IPSCAGLQLNVSPRLRERFPSHRRLERPARCGNAETTRAGAEYLAADAGLRRSGRRRGGPGCSRCEHDMPLLDVGVRWRILGQGERLILPAPAAPVGAKTAASNGAL